jgi:hypothetical protein
MFEELIGKIEDDGLRESIQTALKSAIDEASSSATSSLDKVTQKNKELVSELRELKKSSSNLPDDFDPEKWAELTELEKQIKEDKLKASENWEQLKADLNAAHDRELEKRQQRIKALEGALERQLVDNAAIQAISSAEGNQNLLLPHVKGSLKMIEDADGEFKAIVVDSQGNPRMNAENHGNQFTIKELVAEMQANKDFAPAFRNTNAGGNASGSTQVRQGVNNPFDKKTWNLTEQALMKKSNPELASQMQKAAQG